MTDPSHTIIDTSNLLGTTISGRYAVKKLLGEGSMGIVFLAEHTLMKKKVALKVMRAEYLENPEAVERFQREAQATGHIEHPHVCTATDFGQLDDERFFLVMEYLEGKTLGDLLDEEQRLEPARAVKITEQIARGLQRAHELEVVHRDLKPDNVILVEREGDAEFVKITDFGVARVEVVEAQKLTQAGTTMGTPVYMSPEQAVAKRADARSDLYTLGIMLFEMLTGSVPFYSESLAVILSKHAGEPPPSMHDVAPDAMIPKALVEIVEKLLHKKPEERFQSAVELLAALEDVDLSPYVPDLAAEKPPKPKKKLNLPPPPTPSDADKTSFDQAVSGSDMFGSSEGALSVDDDSAATVTDEATDVAEPSAPEDASEVSEAESDADEGDAAETIADSEPPEHEPSKSGPFDRFYALPVPARYGIVFAGLLILVLPAMVAISFWLIDDDAAASGDDDTAMAFSEDEVAPVDLAEERADFIDDVDLEEKLEKAGPEDTVKALEPLLAEHGENPHLHYLLATARADSGAVGEAMNNYEAALGDPRYAQESRVLSDVRRLFADNDSEVAEPATPVLKKLLEAPNSGAESALLEVAVEGSWRARKRSRDLLKETGRWDELDDWQRHAVDLGLVGKEGCERALKHVKALADSGEPGALPALKKADRRPKSGCGLFKKSDCYRCMRDDLSRAIKKLEEAEPPPVEAPAADEPDE